MTTTATETEEMLMETNRFRLETVADRQRKMRTRDYVFAFAALVSAGFLATLALNVIR